MSRKFWQHFFSIFLFLGLLVSAVSPVVAAPQAATATGTEKAASDLAAFTPTVIFPEKSDSSPALRTITPTQIGAVEERVVPLFQLPKAAGVKSNGTFDASGVQTSVGPTSMPAPMQSFDGLGNLFGGWPPDTEGDIGPDHYVQWINLHLAIWEIDKVHNTATMVYGPVPGNTLFAGFGGPCETTNDGDPIALYDPIADRWFLSQFALPNFPSEYFQCIAISKTGDPTGEYWRYQYSWPGGMNDYPKFGVWPDAYYMTANQFINNATQWGGAGVAAFNRAKMMAGNPSAEMVYFNLLSVNVNFGGMLPADFDGMNLPPVGAPGLFAEWDDSTTMPDPSDTIRVWEFHVDFATPANSTFGLSGDANFEIPTINVDPNMCNGNRACIPQPGTSAKVDAISDRLMYRLQYRNFGSYQTLVSNHTVDATGTDIAGIHWFELRDNGTGWDMQQEGVYQPDTNNRWMGAAALDHVGDLALGYSVSSSSVYPSVRYAGRLVSDPINTLPQAEVSLVVGSGSQTDTTYSRWGDYSMMGVDPSDDCTFWYTQEYVAVTGTNTWKTRIGSFKFPTCSIGPTGTLNGTVTDAITTLGIDGATIQATKSPTQTFTTDTLADGTYELTLPIGTYEVKASAYGYDPEVAASVNITTDHTTTQDFVLNQSAMATIDGNVTDAITSWPLYAKITIDGFPGEPIWTNPVTGYYSIELASGLTYTFHVEAWVDGYLTFSEDVLVTVSTTKDFELDADPITCNAPGYTLNTTGGLIEHFDASTVPAGWSVINNGGIAVWRFDNPEPRTNLTGGTGNFAIADSDFAGVGLMNTELRTPALDFTSAAIVPLQFKYDYYNLGDIADVDVSNNGGSTWTNVWHKTASDRGPKTADIDISAIAAGHNNVVVRWHYYNADYDWWWEVDDVSVGTTISSCTPSAGGLVVGNVYDDNTSDPLVGADVSNDSGKATTTVANPGDLAHAPAFYTLFSPSGAHDFTAAFSGYGEDIVSVNVVGNGTVGQDFNLQAGFITYVPPALEATVELGNSTTIPLTLTNSGGLAATWEFIEMNGGFVPSAPQAGADVLVVNDGGANTSATTAFTTALTNLGYTYQTVNSSSVTGIPAVLGDYSVVIYAGVADTGAEQNQLIAFLDSGGSLLIADNDLGYYQKTSAFYQTYLQATYVSDNGSKAILTGYDIMAGLTVDISSDPYPDDFTLGSAATGIFQKTPGSANWGGSLIERMGYKAIYLAWDYYYAGGIAVGDPIETTILDRAMKVLVPPIPWLSENPSSGVLNADTGSQVVNVTFDSDVPEVAFPGTYFGELKIANDTPYIVPSIPVTMTVEAPATFGKVEGTVTGLGYCDASPAPLVGAKVLIEGSDGYTATVVTDGTGYYQWWLDQAHSPLTLTVTADEHAVGTKSSVILTGGHTITEDFDLRWLKPCMSVDPTSLQVVVAKGYSLTTTLAAINNGAADTGFQFGEVPGTLQQESRPVETVAAPTSITIGDNSISLNPNPKTEASNQESLPPKSPNAITITESNSQTIIALNSVSCNAGGLHTDNHYLRVFDLPAFGITTDFNVTNVEIGIEQAVGSGGTQPAEIRLYTLSGPLLWANLTLIASAPVNVSDQSLTILNMPVEGTIPAGSQLVVDFFTPNGQTAGNSLFVGSNNLGQTAPTYLSATTCGAPEPTNVASLGFPGMHLVMNVTGDLGALDVPWLSEVPVSGTVEADSVFDVAIYFDSMTYTVGIYEASLILKTDDPVHPTINIPVVMQIVNPAAPVASFSSNSPVLVGSPMVFTNNSYRGSPESTEFKWDFGDGITQTVSTTEPVSHTYATFGTFHVTLTVCNVVGCSTDDANVVVLPKKLFLPAVNKG